MANKHPIELFRVEPHTKVNLREWDPAWAGIKEMHDLGTGQPKGQAEELIRKNLERLADAQELLWASDQYALLVVLQGMDASGKDGLVKHVMSGINPQGCPVFSFKRPTDEDLEHDFLWRYVKCLPARGRIGIFNRSYYEDVLVVRVHPEWLDREKLSERGPDVWRKRYDDINQFEKHLVRNNTVILKFFLHISKKEQKRRLLERLDNPKKQWKFSEADLAERARWREYVNAYEDALSATSTKRAPWYIVPADHKWVARYLVSQILTSTIRRLDLKFPQITKQQRGALAKAKQVLEQD